MYEDKDLTRMIGSTIKRIFMNEEFLKFETDKGNFVYSVDGDCCSTSVFYDFYGVKKLFGKVVKSVESVELLESDRPKDKKEYQESISVYGYRITTEDEKLGDVSSVFSFRNYSNGYYGGSMGTSSDQEVKPEIFDDVIETQNKND